MDLKTLAANESTLYLWLTCTVLSRSCFSSKCGWLVMLRPVQSFTPASNCMLPANTAYLGVVELQRIKVGDLCLITTTLWCTLLSLGWACVRIYASGTALRMCVYACLLAWTKPLTVYQILNFQAKILHRTEITYIVRIILMSANHNYASQTWRVSV